MTGTTVYLALSLLAGSLYLICVSIYRVFASPIAHFPGPKLAALTYWYEFYYDVICRGQYEFKIAKMHEEYGPIVRINPRELHINDPGYHDTVYPGAANALKSGQVEKWDWAMKQFGNTLSAFGTCDHNLHRIRRAAVAPLFSKRAVNALQLSVQGYVDRFMQRLSQSSGTVVNIVDAFSALTADIISDYAFGRPLGFLESHDFTPSWHKLIIDVSELGHVCKQFTWILPIMQSLPPVIAQALNPPLAEMVKVVELIRRRIAEVDVQRKNRTESDDYGSSHKTVFHEVLESAELPDPEKTFERLEQEAQILMLAGTATTADTLAAAVFHLLTKPHIVQRMQEELETAIYSLETPRRLKLEELEQLPYLTAIIKESLRIAHGVVQRTARVRPKSDLIFDKWRIPPETPVSMSAWMTHRNPTVFPEPDLFRPERWLSTDAGSKTESQRLEKYLVAFGKGTRQCLGLNLAYAEMYLTLAALFAGPSVAQLTSVQPLQLSLFETDESDILFARDCFMPAPKPGSNGVRVTINQA